MILTDVLVVNQIKGVVSFFFSVFKCLEKSASIENTLFSLQYFICGPRCVDQVAENGGSRRSPDRTHDHDRGERRQPTGPASALITRT